MNLLFGVHNHQPVGNFEDVFKKATSECYRPFIETLYRYPDIKATLHFSGSLIDWLLKNDSALLQKVKQMLKRAQVELLSGGYYEPILPIIPQRDALGQINMLSGFIRDYFEYEPRGIWIGERVWHPQLIKTLARAGIKYTLLDDYHFRYSGLKEEGLLGYYLAEDGGPSLAVFPISKKLRYIIPFSAPAEPIKYLKELAVEDKEAAATIIDDGEKFGLWPGTHKWVYGRKWLEKFFTLLCKNQDWLKTQTLSEYMAAHRPLGSCRLKASAYEEMMAWSGGAFENFFKKYPEANNLHRRMLYVSAMLNRDCLPAPKNAGQAGLAGTDANEGLLATAKEAQRHLYMGQCNCPYWHGVFGGLYLGHLRQSAYKNLITAQALIEKEKGLSCAETERLDFDKETSGDLILKNPLLNIFVSPLQGGAVFELDYKPAAVNLTDVMTRVPESYHRKLKAGPNKGFPSKEEALKNIHSLLGSKEKGLEKFLVYDSYRRVSLLDHFFRPGLPFEDFKACRYEQLGGFIDSPYTVREKKEARGIVLVLQRQAKVRYAGRGRLLKITKEIFLHNSDAQFSIFYKLENLSGSSLDIIFGLEFNLSFENQDAVNQLSCDAEGKRTVYSPKDDICEERVEKIQLRDALRGTEIDFRFDKPAGLWACPLETVSASESGFERNYQQTLILPHWPLKLEKAWQAGICCNVRSL